MARNKNKKKLKVQPKTQFNDKHDYAAHYLELLKMENTAGQQARGKVCEKRVTVTWQYNESSETFHATFSLEAFDSIDGLTLSQGNMVDFRPTKGSKSVLATVTRMPTIANDKLACVARLQYSKIATFRRLTPPYYIH